MNWFFFSDCIPKIWHAAQKNLQLNHSEMYLIQVSHSVHLIIGGENDSNSNTE